MTMKKGSKTKYSEEFHLEGKAPFVKDTYNYVKSSLSLILIHKNINLYSS